MNNIEKQKQKKHLKKQLKRFAISALLTCVLLAVCTTVSAAPSITFDLGDDVAAGSYGMVDLLFTVTLIALVPSLLVMMTSFTRIIIVLSFMRNALGTQQSPPNIVLIGLGLFLTLFVMSPVLGEINEQAFEPYQAGEITQEEFIDIAQVPLKEFMLKQTYQDDLALFVNIANNSRAEDDRVVVDSENLTDLGLEIVVPSFVTSELKRAFNIGFLLFIPFLIIDIVVASTLMSMGIVMLPPSLISLPFKIMMFVLVDGWNLLFSSLVAGFN